MTLAVSRRVALVGAELIEFEEREAEALALAMETLTDQQTGLQVTQWSFEAL